MGFLDENYLITSKIARELYDEISDLPIVDPHNHADVLEIVKNEPWPDIWQVEGATDHYVWELMRRRGVPEDEITGSASNKEKWLALADNFPDFIGNPTYEWVHLDLYRRFDLKRCISSETAEEIWEVTSSMLQEPSMRPQGLLESMNVEVMCTTDDPTMDLSAHKQAASVVARTKIFPTWRPDKSMVIESPRWKPFVEQVCAETGESPESLDGLLSSLAKTHEYFDSCGCVASDHGLTQPYSHHVSQNRAAAIHSKAFDGKSLAEDEIADYKAFLFNYFGELNAAADWVLQMHIGVVRDYRDVLDQKLGPDTGGDISTHETQLVENLHHFLNTFDGRLKIVLYCIDPTHVPTLGTVARAFPNVTLGAPWWFNDSPYGMEVQLKYLATVDLLSNHAGMVTDSRKLISFGSRTEMFRRILCEVVGEMILKGQIPEGPALDLVKSLSHDRPRDLFFG